MKYQWYEMLLAGKENENVIKSLRYAVTMIMMVVIITETILPHVEVPSPETLPSPLLELTSTLQFMQLTCFFHHFPVSSGRSSPHIINPFILHSSNLIRSLLFIFPTSQASTLFSNFIHFLFHTPPLTPSFMSPPRHVSPHLISYFSHYPPHPSLPISPAGPLPPIYPWQAGLRNTPVMRIVPSPSLPQVYDSLPFHYFLWQMHPSLPASLPPSLLSPTHLCILSLHLFHLSVYLSCNFLFSFLIHSSI